VFAKKQVYGDRIDSLIGVGSCIRGNIVFSGGLRVDGEIIGDVSGQQEDASTLVISEKALIKGAVRVGRLVLNGKIEGPIRALFYLELQSKCRVLGDVYYSKLEMHPGAVVVGQLIHLPEEELAMLPRPESTVHLCESKQD